MFRSGFSLMEVNMAILIAAGGMLSLFSLFPTSLKQVELSSEDLYQSTYASSVFQMIAGNIATIYDIEDWNDVDTFWDIATEGTGLPSLKKGTTLSKSDILYELSSGNASEKDGEKQRVWYAGTDFSSNSSNDTEGKPSLPEQYVIRLYKKYNLEPAVYVVSFVCSSFKAPVVYQNNPVFSMEFSYQGKVWSEP